MSTSFDVPLPPDFEMSDESTWSRLYSLLTPLARSWAFHARVATWQGQEQDVAEDIVQVAMLKIVQYLEETRKNGIAIEAFEHLCVVIAKHSFLDMRRREIRLLHFSHDKARAHEQSSLDLLVDPSQEAEEKMYEEWLLAASAQTIAAFSTKLRAAILADLANRSCFDSEPSVLQQAFLAADICLEDYQRAPSPDPVERSRQSALRSLAYKRLSQANLG